MGNKFNVFVSLESYSNWYLIKAKNANLIGFCANTATGFLTFLLYKNTYKTKKSVGFLADFSTCIVGSRGDVQLGGPVLALAGEVPLRLRLLIIFYSLKVSLRSKEIRTLV